MDIQINIRCEQALPLDRIEELAHFVLEREGADDALELSLSFVGTDEMAALNATYRNKSGPTDVLSFECDSFSDDPEEYWPDNSEEVENPVILGDIVICPEVAARHALKEEVTLEEELWILVIHGILHLLGFDHVQLMDAEEMEAREDEHFYQWELMLGVL